MKLTFLYRFDTLEIAARCPFDLNARRLELRLEVERSVMELSVKRGETFFSWATQVYPLIWTCTWNYSSDLMITR